MTSVVARMKQEDHLMVEITSDTDDLCASCPNRVDEIHCTDDGKVREYDRKVCEYFDIVIGKQYNCHDLIAKIKADMTPAIQKDICGSCSWFPLCEISDV